VGLDLEAGNNAQMDGMERTLTITAAGAGQMDSKQLKVAVLFLPAGDASGSGHRVVKQGSVRNWFYETLTLARPAGKLELVLIPQDKHDDPPTFYIMVEKVSVGQFLRFTKAPESQGQVGDGWNAADPKEYPALGMTWKEAELFAENWAGGGLPSTRQWDKAAGYSEWESKGGKDEQAGPFRGRWGGAHPLDIAVGGNKKALGDAQDDWCTTSGCRDMAGNGKEWTSTARPGNNQLMELRGQSFEVSVPLLFKDLKRGIVAVKYQAKRDLDLGFRVVVEPQ
jgi:formylglycine-generating enzyme required for sulfatase activity